jgi:hypothetical protein
MSIAVIIALSIICMLEVTLGIITSQPPKCSTAILYVILGCTGYSACMCTWFFSDDFAIPGFAACSFTAAHVVCLIGALTKFIGYENIACYDKHVFTSNGTIAILFIDVALLLCGFVNMATWQCKLHRKARQRAGSSIDALTSHSSSI